MTIDNPNDLAADERRAWQTEPPAEPEQVNTRHPDLVKIWLAVGIAMAFGMIVGAIIAFSCLERWLP